jgi:hypothetical protein
MKINFDEKINDLSGNPLKNQFDTKGGDMTLGSICVQGLIAVEDGDRDGNEKFKRYELAMRLNKGGEQNLTNEDAVLIKKQIGRFFSVLVVGQAYNLLEGK